MLNEVKCTTLHQPAFKTAADDLLSTYGLSGEYVPKLWVPKAAIRVKAPTPVASPRASLSIQGDTCQDVPIRQYTPQDDPPQDDPPRESSPQNQQPQHIPSQEVAAEEEVASPKASLPEPSAPARMFTAKRPTFKWPTGDLPPDYDFALVTPGTVSMAVSDTSWPEEARTEDIIFEKWIWPTGRLPPEHVIRLPSPPESPSMIVSSYVSSEESDAQERIPDEEEKEEEERQEEEEEEEQEEEEEKDRGEAEKDTKVQKDKASGRKLFGRGAGYKARKETSWVNLIPKWPTGQLPTEEGDEWSSVVAEINSSPDLDIEVPSEAEARKPLFGRGIGFRGRRPASALPGLKFPTGRWRAVPPSPLPDRRSSTSTTAEVPLALHEQRAQRRLADLQYLMACEGVL